MLGPLRRLTRLGRALVALGAVLLAAAGLAFAAGPSGDPVGAMVGYIQRAQNLDGGFGGVAGAPSDPGFTAWTAMALASAGINPRDQRKVGGTDVHSYLLAHAHRLDVTTDFERVALVSHAAGTSLRDFGGIDLVQRILERQNQDGSFPHDGQLGAGGVNDTIWAVISLSVVREEPVRERLERATDWILRAQNADGGWPAVAVGSGTDLDMTGAAIQALNASGRRDTEQQRKALAFLRSKQFADGGFPSILSERESNTATTAWVVQGIWSAGLDPRDWDAASGADPLDYLVSMQREDGSIQWKRSQDLNPLWMTAYSAPAYAGHPQPLPVQPRVCGCVPPTALTDYDRAMLPPDPPTQPGGTGGEGGTGTQGGGQALAGGGGRGAPLFSRPRVESQGRKRGGVRRTRDAASRARRQASTQRRNLSAAHERSTAQRRGTGPAAPASGPASEPPAPSAGSEPPTPEPVVSEPAAPPAEPAVPLTGEGDAGAGAVTSEDATEQAGGAGGDTPETAGSSAAGADPEVTGTLLGGAAEQVAAGEGGAEAAPGIRGARAGADPEPAVALGLSGLLLVAAGFGTQLERRRPDEELK